MNDEQRKLMLVINAIAAYLNHNGYDMATIHEGCSITDYALLNDFKDDTITILNKEKGK